MLVKKYFFFAAGWALHVQDWIFRHLSRLPGDVKEDLEEPIEPIIYLLVGPRNFCFKALQYIKRHVGHKKLGIMAVDILLLGCLPGHLCHSTQ